MLLLLVVVLWWSSSFFFFFLLAAVVLLVAGLLLLPPPPGVVVVVGAKKCAHARTHGTNNNVPEAVCRYPRSRNPLGKRGVRAQLSPPPPLVVIKFLYCL